MAFTNIFHLSNYFSDIYYAWSLFCVNFCTYFSAANKGSPFPRSSYFIHGYLPNTRYQLMYYGATRCKFFVEFFQFFHILFGVYLQVHCFLFTLIVAWSYIYLMLNISFLAYYKLIINHLCWCWYFIFYLLGLFYLFLKFWKNYRNQ